jgi:hypothetical protein
MGPYNQGQMGKTKAVKAIANSLKNIRDWYVVLEGEAAGIWSGTKPLKALGLLKEEAEGLPPHKRAKGLTQALTFWFQRHKVPPVVGVGRNPVLRPGAEEYGALASFLREVHRVVYGEKRAEEAQYLVRTDGSYSDRQNAVGFAVAVYARQGGAYKEVGPYFAVIQEAIRAKGLKVAARKAKRVRYLRERVPELFAEPGG